MKCYNKECKQYENGRDTTDCIMLYTHELEKCIEHIDEETYKQVNNAENLNECEWEYKEHPRNKCMYYSSSCSSLRLLETIIDFKYCPYCGKSIKIKGE